MCARSIKWVLFTCASETTLLAMTESYILKEVTVKMPEFSIGNMPLSTDRIKILSSFQLAYQWYQRAFMFRWTSAWLGMAACLAVGRICWSHLIDSFCVSFETAYARGCWTAATAGVGAWASLGCSQRQTAGNWTPAEGKRRKGKSGEIANCSDRARVMKHISWFKGT